MERNHVVDLLRELQSKYGKPRAGFDTDDYYRILRFIPVDRIADLKRTIIEECSYFPKPAEIKKISYQFKQAKIVTNELDDPNLCIYTSCKADLRQYPSESPYMCTGCYKAYMDNVDVIARQYESSGMITGKYIIDEDFGKMVLSKDLPI